MAKRKNVDAIQVARAGNGAEQLPEQIDGISMVPHELAEGARTAWTQAYDAYYRKGGINDLKAQLETLNKGEASVGNLLLRVGKACLLHAGNDPKAAIPLFKGACMIAETEAKQEHAGTDGKAETIQKILPTWAPAKSVVLQGLQKGLALNDADSNGNEKYPHITAVRTQVSNMNRSNRGQGGNGGSESTVDTVLKAFSSDRLRIALTEMFKNLVALEEPQQDEAAEVIMQSIAGIAALRPETEEKRAAAQGAAHAVKHHRAKKERAGAAQAA
jgi:hypothetical protein